ncbi:MAG: DEAD/DEAH box helicase family protein [bacterium]|nr:DEAD/DEAH box helicase family protein [bacterium]
MSRKSLIVNSPYAVPQSHWVDKDGRLELVQGRRPASYEIFDPQANTKRTERLDRVNSIRERVDEWREDNYPGITTITRGLLEHWNDRNARQLPFYFCQLEAIETLIWWVEAPTNAKQGINIPGDGGEWERLCNKMATGAGKTTVMAMLIAWQVLNAMMFPKENKRFSKAIFLVAPGLTVRERLQVLLPGNINNYYDEFSICPSPAMRQRLNGAVIQIENWHSLMPLNEPQRSVVKKGPESDRAFVKRVLGALAEHKDIIVINDEAHHAYRVPKEVQLGRKVAEEQGFDLDEATKWIEGLDRIHSVLRINRCFDLSATPFTPSGKKASEQSLFGWIVSDFGLNDAIEGGLVKTPRVVIRDGIIPDTTTLRPKLYHLYRQPEVGEDLNRRGADPHEALPQLVQQAYSLLAHDWRETARAWKNEGHASPPVMLTVCNRTETAARIEFYFQNGGSIIPELHDASRMLRVDSKVLNKAEIGEAAGSDKAYEEHLRMIINASNIAPDEKHRLDSLKKEELLRAIVDTVGKNGKPGQNLQKVISVAMLSEGWDAKNVTHIMGLRAFTSQLLCEQVIGRGLRRVSYDLDENGLFTPEYVNVFGVPLSIFQDVEGDDVAPPPPKPTHQIEVVKARTEHEIKWPNIVRVEHVIRTSLVVDWDRVEPLYIDPASVLVHADLAPALGTAEDFSKVKSINLEEIPEAFRLQRLVFQAAQKAWLELHRRYSGSSELLLMQLVRIAEQFIASKKIEIPSEFYNEPLRRRILVGQSMDRVVQHLLRYVIAQNQEGLEAVFDEQQPLGSTAWMHTWFTSRTVRPTVKCQINYVVTDSAWESLVANGLEESPNVSSWVKNDHQNFHILYLWNGSRRKYQPDFICRMTNGETLVIEVKGQPNDESRTKKAALETWIAAVNADGRFGVWRSVELDELAMIQDVLRLDTPSIA